MILAFCIIKVLIGSSKTEIREFRDNQFIDYHKIFRIGRLKPLITSVTISKKLFTLDFIRIDRK